MNADFCKKAENDNFPIYAYRIKDAIYINTTSNCSNVCDFCIKFTNRGVEGYNLEIADDPSVNDTKRQIDDILKTRPEIKKIVFCGLGESTYRLEFMEEIAKTYKPLGFSFRLNTNGHGNKINGFNIIPRLSAFLNSISISLNAHNSELYEKMCNPTFENAYNEMLDFTKKCVGQIPEVFLSVVEMPGIDISKCAEIAKNIGASFKLRPYINPDTKK
ncbi:MAG: TatD family nuclease-associated radical SAM protein [Candidatus Wallbacteria bacterium]